MQSSLLDGSSVYFIILHIMVLPVLLGSLSQALLLPQTFVVFQGLQVFPQGSACKLQCKSLKVTF